MTTTPVVFDFAAFTAYGVARLQRERNLSRQEATVVWAARWAAWTKTLEFEGDSCATCGGLHLVGKKGAGDGLLYLCPSCSLGSADPYSRLLEAMNA